MHVARFLTLCFALTLLTITPLTALPHTESTIVSTDLSNLSYSQELQIPIDTTQEHAINQPIDICVTFNQPCWAKNETIHSVRVAYSDGSDFTEIESQIYDLSYTDDAHIDECSLVFLIPEEATGEETYHLFYSNSETSTPAYPDHITVKDTHYFYEPITGQIMDFDYYQINQDDNVIYGISQKGELLGNGMSNAVIKLLPNSKDFATKNAEQIAGFYTSYSIDPPGEHIGTQWARDITKSILVDGNLMTRIRIKGTSPNGAVLTDNIYTYYYNPNLDKRLIVNTNHQTLKDIQVKGTQQREGTFASLSTIKARSGTIDDMNLGEILPKIHFYDEDGTIVDYDMPTNPEAHPADWLLGFNDDQDLGDKAWLCIDDPQSGRAHGLIFEGNTGFLEGEHDGIQVKASVHQHVKLPGLEADSGDLFAFRNAYENGNHLTTLSKGENIQFNVEYYAIQNGGYERINQESEFFQKRINECPITRGNQTLDEEPTEEPERFTLKTTVRQAFSAPLGSLLSAALGRNISYLTAELHKAKTLVSSGSVGRLKFNSLDIEFEEDAGFIQKMGGVLSLFDFKNSTLMKTITFNDIEAGMYLVKIYKENPMFHDNRQFIGFTIVEINEDTSIRINCKKQTTVETTITDQENAPLENIQTQLLLDDIVISESVTDSNGIAKLSVPLYTNKEFTIKSFYDGFLIYEDVVSLNFLNRFRAWATSFSINRYNLKLTVEDTLGLSPGIDPRPQLKSQEMKKETSISAEQIDEGLYEFTNLYEATYDLTLSYKSWEITKPVPLSRDTALNVMFPAEFDLEIIILNKVGSPINKANIILERSGKEIEGSINENGIALVTAPPGSYTLTVFKDETIIASQNLVFKGDKSVDLVSNHPSLLHEILPIILIISGIVIATVLFWKTNSTLGLYIFIGFLIVSSIVLPWWQLNGETNNTETISETYLYPPTLITRTESGDVIGGEISEVPDIFTTVLSLLSIILIITSALIIANIYMGKRFAKISIIINIFILILLMLTIGLFYISMSEVTKIGIGDFFGSGEISISIPGESNQQTVSSTWGAGLGAYTVIASLIGFIILSFGPYIQLKLRKIKKDDASN